MDIYIDICFIHRYIHMDINTYIYYIYIYIYIYIRIYIDIFGSLNIRKIRNITDLKQMSP